MNKLAIVTGGYSILDFDFGYSEERVLEVLGSYGEEGMALYGRIQLLDILNPAIYSLFFASILYLLFKKGGFAWVVILPLLAGALDYAENITLYILSSSYPDISGTIVSLSSSLSIVKKHRPLQRHWNARDWSCSLGSLENAEKGVFRPIAEDEVVQSALHQEIGERAARTMATSQ